MSASGFRHRQALYSRRRSEETSPRKPSSAKRANANFRPVAPAKNGDDLDGRASGEIIIINVSGQRYETRSSTLDRFPQTLLGCPLRRRRFYEESREEYFFERSRKCFASILDYYQTNGTLRRPVNVAFHIFVGEIIFYDLGEDVLQQFLAKEDMLLDVPIVPTGGVQEAIWRLFEVPTSSRPAQIIAGCNVILVVVAVINFCIQTLPEYQSSGGDDSGERDLSAILGIGIIANSTARGTSHAINGMLTPFFVAETICNTWFLIDLVVRFAVSPIKRTFFFQFMNIVDALSVFPYFIDLLSIADSSSDAQAKRGLVLLILFRLFRILRIFRILKLSRYSDGLEILWLTMKSARQELGVLFMIISIGMTLFSASMYYTELGYRDSDFPSIPHAFWFTVITWTSVGYGDCVPKRPLGKLVGGICSTTGVICLAFILPVVVTHFEYYFHRGKELRKLKVILDQANQNRPKIAFNVDNSDVSRTQSQDSMPLAHHGGCPLDSFIDAETGELRVADSRCTYAGRRTPTVIITAH